MFCFYYKLTFSAYIFAREGIHQRHKILGGEFRGLRRSAFLLLVGNCETQNCSPVAEGSSPVEAKSKQSSTVTITTDLPIVVEPVEAKHSTNESNYQSPIEENYIQQLSQS